MRRPQNVPRIQSGFATLELAISILACGSLLVPLIGVFDLVLTRAALQSATHNLSHNAGLAPFRLFSGHQSWFTRPVNGGDERNLQGRDNHEVLLETEQYHKTLSTIAAAAQQTARQALGCARRDCPERYRAEVRVLVPYITYDTAELIRLVCFRRADQSDGESCPAGLSSDVDEFGLVGRTQHRFLRVRGALRGGERLFLESFIQRIGAARSQEGETRRGSSLRYAASPGGMLGVDHAQYYGEQDFVAQHGYRDAPGVGIEPNYLRHVVFIGVRIYLDLEGSPAGYLLALTRSIRPPLSDGISDTILFEDDFSVLREDF